MIKIFLVIVTLLPDGSVKYDPHIVDTSGKKGRAEQIEMCKHWAHQKSFTEYNDGRILFLCEERWFS